MASPDSTVTALSAESVDERARAKALAAFVPPQPVTQWVSYQSRGRLLLIGTADEAWPLAKALNAQLDCTVLATRRPTELPGSAPPVPTVYGSVHNLTGYLGAFDLELETEAGTVADGKTVFGSSPIDHDLVLDLQREPSIDREVMPPGYYHAFDATSREQALRELPDMIGEFEKPRFIHYDPDICAHGERGLAGCRNCLDTCAADAPISVGERIEVNFNLCQGCGSCTVVCPTGALTYATPPATDLLGSLRRLLAEYRVAGGTTPVFAFHGEACDPTILQRLPGPVLPVAVENIGALGIEAWLTLLAYGAHQIQLFAPADTAPTVLKASRDQIDLAGQILAARGDRHGKQRIVLLTETEAALTEENALPALTDEPATFAALGNKREIFHMALAHLCRHAPDTVTPTPLPENAPFGAIEVNGDACTLCMACVSVCPAAAVQGGGDEPKLWFREDRCVQCGLCEIACPEDAIQLEPRLDFGAHLQPEKRLLNEEHMQLCLDCGKPFATHKVIARMQEKLQGHWMFQTEEAKQILLLCEDCRIRRAWGDNSSIQPHRD